MKKASVEKIVFSLFEAGVFLSFLGVYLSVSLIGLGTGIVLLFGLVYLALTKRWQLVLRNPLAVPMAILATAILLSIAFAAPYDFEKPLGKVRYLACMFLFAAYFVTKPEGKNWVVRWGRWLAVGLGVIAILQFLGIFSPLPLFGGRPPSPIPQANGMLFLATGFAFHHSPFACTMILLFHIFFARWILSMANERHLQYGLPIVFSSIGILCSFSRGAWIAWVVSTMLVTLMVSWRKALAAAGTLAALLVAAFATVPAFRRRVLDARPSQNEDRLELWRICFEMFKDSPLFGHGFYSFGSRYQSYTDAHLKRPHFPVEAHNMYMDLLSGTGLVGIGSFFYFLFRWLKLAVDRFRANLDSETRAWGLACIGMWASFVLAGIFDKQFYMTQTLVPHMFFLGILTSLPSRNRSTNLAMK